MIKTILFGAGEGCRKFINNKDKQREYLAIADNDSSRSDTYFENIIMISPDKIKDFEYDEIVIVTQWADQVKKQLIETLNISNESIYVPPKNILKKPEPFLHPATHDLANTILKTLTKNAQIDKIPLLVDFGTLLGLVRDNKIMEWDDDIDFAIALENSEGIEEWLCKIVNNNEFPVDLYIEKTKDKNNCLVAFLLKFESENYKPFTTSITFRDNSTENSVHMPSLGLWYAPAKHFTTYEEIQWAGIDIKVPFEYKDYLTFLYGEWSITKKFINMTDYNNLGNVDFEEFKEVGFNSEKI